MSSFALDIRRFVEKTKDRADQAVHTIVANIAAEIDFRSPVGDATYWKSPPPKGYVGGRFRANWQLGVGSVDVATTMATDRSPKNRETGGTTTRGIVASIPAQAAGKVYYLSNSLPYAQRIENGWSRQAPSGVVGLTQVRFQQIVRKAIAELPE